MQTNKLRYLAAGVLGAGAVLLASAGASAHAASIRTVSSKSPTPSVAGATTATIVDEADTPEAAMTPEPAETPATGTNITAAAAEPAGANVEQEGDFQGQFGDNSGGDTGD